MLRRLFPKPLKRAYLDDFRGQIQPMYMTIDKYQEYNPDSAGTQRDECLVGDSRRQVLVDGDKDIEVVQEEAEKLRSEPVIERTR